MIYLDSSVALAHLLAEDRFPPDALWDEQLVSSRLLECEVWNRINAHQLQTSHGDAVRNLIGRVAMIEMVGPVLTRALQPFPVPVRTLDAIHLAALEFIRAQKQSVQLASYDERLLAAARVLGIVEWSENHRKQSNLPRTLRHMKRDRRFRYWGRGMRASRLIISRFTFYVN
jgi:PIN domain